MDKLKAVRIHQFEIITKQIEKAGGNLLGILWILGSALLLAIQNVVLKILFSPSLLLGSIPLGGYITPTFPHSLLLLQMRTLLTAIAISAIAPRLHRQTYAELRSLAQPRQRVLLIKTTGSGGLLALALTLLFVAISQLSTGIAVTIFFIYPAITALLARWVFGERLSLVTMATTVIVVVGVFLSAPDTSGLLQSSNTWGVGAALGAGFTYAWQGVLSQSCLKHMHPVPFSVLTFWVMLGICSVGLRFVSVDVSADGWQPLWVGTGITAAVTTVGYLLNNFGIRAIGVTPAFLVSTSTPILTAAIAWLAISEVLRQRQVLGILLVVLGVAVVGFERWRKGK